eukprot:13911826-Ditylum_brightwellii.AAC.1
MHLNALPASCCSPNIGLLHLDAGLHNQEGGDTSSLWPLLRPPVAMQLCLVWPQELGQQLFHKGARCQQYPGPLLCPSRLTGWIDQFGLVGF